MKRVLSIFALLLVPAAVWAQNETPTVVVATTVSCATSTDGSVVGVLNPLQAPIVAAVYSGTLPSGTYYVQIAWYDAAAHLTLVSPEVQQQLTATGSLTVNLPASGKPSTAVGMKVYIGTTSGAETLQGSTTGSATFTQSTPLTTGAAKPTVNNTVCSIVANDAGWPTGTGYKVGMTTPAGNTMPGYPMQWQLLGPGSTINLGNGFPLYNGTVTYPIPILARPFNHAAQSIAGPLYMTNYSLLQVGSLGIGTSTPGFSIDDETGSINAVGGFVYNGGVGVTAGQCLSANSDPYHTFNVPVTCGGTFPTLYYQTVEANGTAQTQRPVLNYSANFTLNDSSSPARTTVDLSAVGTAGTYVSPSSITFDAFGRETAITASSAVNTTCTGTTPPYTCYRVEPDGTTEEWGAVSVPASGNAFNSASFTFPVAYTNVPAVYVTTVGLPSTTGDATTPVACELQSSSTTGGTAYMARVIVASAGGGNFDQAITLNWSAVGK